jgi:gas vesicle protein
MTEECNVHHLAWLLAGLGAGALVGVLCAPKSGRETRDELASSARESSEFIRTRTRQAADKVSSLVGKGKRQESDFRERGREYIGR